MLEKADRVRFMSRREMAREVTQLDQVIIEQQHFINDLKEALEDARRQR